MLNFYKKQPIKNTHNLHIKAYIITYLLLKHPTRNCMINGLGQMLQQKSHIKLYCQLNKTMLYLCHKTHKQENICLKILK